MYETKPDGLFRNQFSELIDSSIIRRGVFLGAPSRFRIRSPHIVEKRERTGLGQVASGTWSFVIPVAQSSARNQWLVGKRAGELGLSS